MAEYYTDRGTIHDHAALLARTVGYKTITSIANGMCFALSLEFIKRYQISPMKDVVQIWNTMHTDLLSHDVQLQLVATAQDTYQYDRTNTTKTPCTLIAEAMRSISGNIVPLIACVSYGMAQLDIGIAEICSVISRGHCALLCFDFINNGASAGHTIACVSGDANKLSDTCWWMFDPARGVRQAVDNGAEAFNVALTEYLRGHHAQSLVVAEF